MLLSTKIFSPFNLMKQIFLSALILLVSVILINISLSKNKINCFHMKSLNLYYRFNKDGNGYIPLLSPIQKVLDANNMNKANTFYQANLFFMHKLDQHHIFDVLKSIKNYQNKYLYNIVCIDYLSSKSKLYEIYMKRKPNSSIFPISFLLNNPLDIISLQKYLLNNPKKFIILKKNKQQQNGIKIINEYVEAENSEYVIAQELLQNPFLIRLHKINIRVYLLISIVNNELSVQIYNDGFIYYTPSVFVSESSTVSSNVTSGLINRKVYEKNPLTINDFRKYIGDTKSNLFDSNLKKLFYELFSTLEKDIIIIEKRLNMRKFVVMGADVALDENLNLKIMELNKGPDLSFKDERDGKLKYEMIENSFINMNLFNAPKTYHNKYIRII
jgi:hypothetical protein